MADAQLMSLGKRLRRERESHHWTQEQLAEKIGGSVPSINRWEHDRAVPRPDMFQLLVEVFGKPPEQWGSSSPIPWNVPFLRNPYFTGREQILQRLYQALAAEQTVALSQTRAISGLGGVGKTQTAIEYAYRYADEYKAVLWVRADSREALVSDFAALASVFELREQEEADQFRAIAAVKRWLQEHGPWLLIFDNADELAVVSDFLPRRAEGAVLLTTRSQVTGPHIKKIEMEKMSRQEGIAFLLHRMNSGEEERLSTEVSQQEQEAAEQLWECMDGLPLALDQAAAYIEETGCTFSDYLALFKTRSKRLLHLRGQHATAHPEPVATTWSLAFEKVERASPAAAELLRFCAFLHPDEIPETMIIAGASKLGPVLQSIAADGLQWNAVIGELRKYSLVKRDAEKKLLNMHRLVQAVIKDSMDKQTLRLWAERVMLAVNMAFPRPEHSTWPQCERLLPHALLAAHYIETDHLISLEAGRLLHETASYLQEHARYTEAEPLYQRALRIREQQLGLEHPDVAYPLYNLANLYSHQSRYAEAEPLYQRALRIREQQLGAEHPLVAYPLNGLANLYSEQDKHAEAEPLYQRALRIFEHQLGPEHPEVAYPLNGLANCYLEQSRYAEAEPLFQRALHIWERQWGPEHPLVAYPLNNLANLYTEQSRYAEAEPLFQQALHIWEKRLGPEHPEVAISLNNLATLYRRQGKYAEAERLYQRALHIREQALGPQHLDTAETMHDLAELRQVQDVKGNREDAQNWYARALAIREQALGTHHPKTMETRLQLIALLHVMGQHEEATQLEAAQTEQGTREDERKTHPEE